MDNEELGLRHYIVVVLRRKWIVVASTALAIVAALSYTLFQPPVYQAETTVLIEREEGLGRLLAASGDFFIDRSIRTQMELIKSRDVLSRAVVALSPNIDTDQALLAIRAQELGRSVRVSQITATDLVTVTAKASAPALAQARANAVSEAYVAHIVSARVESVNRALEVTSTRLAQSVPGVDTGATQLFEQLQQVQQELELARAAGQIVGLRIVDRALLPQSPAGGRLWLNLVIGSLLGVVLGTTAAFGLEYLDRKVRSDLDLKPLGLPMLGLIPHWDVKTNPHMVTLEQDPKSAFAEAFRLLRANLHFAGVTQPLRSILITSPGPGEGKTLIAMNLARAFAMEGGRILLVDGDLRRPAIRKMFGLPEGLGLTTLLAGQGDLENCTVHLDGLDIITSGPRPPNPGELLGSDRMREFLESVKELYKIVLVDGPPSLGFADALVLAKEVDASLLLSRAGVTDQDAALEAKSALAAAGSTPVGLVLNGVRPGYRGYRYRYYYQYERDDDDDEEGQDR